MYNKKRPFLCPEKNCLKTFTQRPALNAHICIHISGKISSEIQGYLNEHNFRKYICETCEKVFTQVFALENHTFKHTKEKSFACTAKGCSKMYGNRDNVDTHGKKLCRERPFLCPKDDCIKAFSQRSTLNAHVCTHMNGLKKKQSPDIQDYLNEHHFKKYKCDTCRKVFIQSVALQNHLVKHTREKLLAGSSKNRVKNLTREQNVNVHCRKRCYSCPQKNCAKLFTQRPSLNAHICIHMNKPNEVYSQEIQEYLHTHHFKTYTCGICDKVFTQAFACNNHIRTHSMEN